MKIIVDDKATIAALQEFRQFPKFVIGDLAAAAWAPFRGGAGRHSPRPEGTGRLFRSLFHEGKGTIEQTIGHDPEVAPHAQYVVFPTVAHEIKPKKQGGWLAWRSRFGGPMVFRRRVWHPGYEGDNYRDEAAAEAVARLPDFIANRLREI